MESLRIMKSTISQHQFINASAGTGKTYTIMEIIIGIIEAEVARTKETNPDILNRMLILTYTEKATGELKKRLRDKFIEKIKNQKGFKLKNNSDLNTNPEQNQLTDYNKLLQNLDQVNISTIHGFCNMVLREYELETLTHESSTLLPAREKIKEALYELQHNEWNQGKIVGEDLQFLLETSHYFEKKEELLIPAIEKYLSGREYQPDWKEFLTFPDKVANVWEKINLNLNDLNRQTTEILLILNDLDNKLELNGKSKTTFLRVWKAIQNAIEDLHKSQLNNQPLSTQDKIQFLSRVNDILGESRSITIDKKSSTLRGFDVLEVTDNLFKANTNPASKENLKDLSEPLITILKDRFEELPDFLQNGFLTYTLYLAMEILEKQLEDSEWITYDAMIQIVRKAVESNPELVQALRDRFDICIVDEFQDTDKSQYSIFRKIFFDESQLTNKSLILIGDPKQSIYSFRGADIGTYLQAEKDFKLFQDRKTLDTNYRSVPELIEAYNRLFSQRDEIQSMGSNSYFPINEAGGSNQSNEFQINYLPVKAPQDFTKFALNDKFKEGPLHIVYLNKDKQLKIGDARESWADFIANQILVLTEPKTRFQFDAESKDQTESRGHEPKKIRLNDIAILIRNNKEGSLIQQYLKRYSIPYSYYKERGIYQSKEAYQIQNIFQCLLESNKPSSYRKLLLGDLFKIPPERLAYFDEHSIDSFEKTTMDHWKKLVQDNKYAELFKSIEQSSFIFWASDHKSIEWERKITNYRQIFQKLHSYQINNRVGLEEILQELNSMIQEKTNEEEQPLYEKETEKDAVQILTLHASKGLEWPIVFLSSLSEFKPGENYDYPDVNQETTDRVWKMSLTDPDKTKYRNSSLNDAKRILYVGITRAQIRLYLPYFASNSNNLEYKSILFPRLEQEILSQEAYNKKLFTLINWNGTEKSKSQKFSEENESRLQENKLQSNYRYFIEDKFLNSKKLLSYSSIAKFSNEMNLLVPETKSEIPDDEDRDFKTSSDLKKDEQKSALPFGKKSGEFLHKLFEKISFQEFTTNNKKIIFTKKENPLDSILIKESIRYGISNLKSKETISKDKQNQHFLTSDFREESLNILWNTLNASLPSVDGKTFSLNELDERNKISEMLFQFTQEDSYIIKGYVDLIFFYKDRFYIADYKSNRLDDISDQGLSLKIHDDDSSYYLQRDLYALVLWKYLSKIYDPKIALSKFGGVYFFFVRYMKESENIGVYSEINSTQNSVWNQDRFIKIEEDLKLRIEPILQD
jgi:exodeoxyribonuclease V beta subunit